MTDGTVVNLAAEASDQVEEDENGAAGVMMQWWEGGREGNEQMGTMR